MAELTPEQRVALRAPDSRMDAYYYSFDRTGVPAIDAILSAVAYAGKAFHGTDQWYDTDVNYGPITGDCSAADLIQRAANDAASELRDSDPLDPLPDEDFSDYVDRTKPPIIDVFDVTDPER
jgi:hypothetical protein